MTKGQTFKKHLAVALDAGNVSDAVMQALNTFNRESDDDTYPVYLDAFQQYLTIAQKETVTMEDAEAVNTICTKEQETYNELTPEEAVVKYGAVEKEEVEMIEGAPASEKEVVADPSMIPAQNVTEQVYPAGDLVETPTAEEPVENVDPIENAETPTTPEQTAEANSTEAAQVVGEAVEKNLVDEQTAEATPEA